MFWGGEAGSGQVWEGRPGYKSFRTIHAAQR